MALFTLTLADNAAGERGGSIHAGIAAAITINSTIAWANSAGQAGNSLWAHYTNTTGNTFVLRHCLYSDAPGDNGGNGRMSFFRFVFRS